MNPQIHRVNITTEVGGAGSGVTPPIRGRISAIRYVKDGTTPFADGVDVTVTDYHGKVLWTGTDVNASAVVAPRQPTHDAVGAASLYAAGGEPVEDHFIVDGPITVAVTSGGDEKVGAFYIEAF